MNSLAIISSLQIFWSTHGPSAVPTVFGGTRGNVSGAPLWVEFWVTQLRDLEGRLRGPRGIDLVVDIHLFSQGRAPREVFSLSDQISELLRMKSLPVHSESTGEITGWLRLKEPKLFDLSRSKTEPLPELFQHLLWSVAATATSNAA